MSENRTDAQVNQEPSLSGLEEGVKLPEKKARGSRRKRLALSLLTLLILAAITGFGAYHLMREKTVDLKANKKSSEKVSSGTDIKQAAFDSISGSLTGPIVKPSPNVGGVNIASGQPPVIEASEITGEKVAAPVQSGISATLAPPPDAALNKRPDDLKQSGQMVDYSAKANAAAASATGALSKSNGIQSVRYSPIARPLEAIGANAKAAAPSDLPAKIGGESDDQKSDGSNKPKPRLINRPSTPNFGAMLPVRLMGVLYTLRIGSLARLELTRDLKTERWQLKRGTVFIGNIVGSNLDRAYLQIKGFIDPDSQAFTKLEGEALGNDGGSGLRGKQRRASPVWVKVLDRAAQAGVQIGTSILNRRSASVIVATDPYGAYRSANGVEGASDQNRNFVEVAAGTVGFVLVTTLPESDTSSSRLAGVVGNLTDNELAELMTEADPARIRAALPKMNPDLQRVAQAVLSEIEAQKP